MARQAKRERGEVLYRAVKWYLEPTPEQERLIIRISDALREYYNWGIEIEREAYERHKAAKEAGAPAPNTPKFYNPIALYNLWKPVRDVDKAASLFRARVPANWVVETFGGVEGAYRSFFALIKNGDQNARTPRPVPETRFFAIPGCSAFSVRRGEVILAPQIFGGTGESLVFSIPPTYQTEMLARASRFAKFVITREERYLARPGRLQISIKYEMEKPETKPFIPEKAVYLALGASSIGVVSPRGEEIIPLWRSDKHWKPRIDAIDEYITRKPTQAEPFPIKKGSRKWRRLREKRDKMFDVVAWQQTLDRREIVAIDLIEHRVKELVLGHGVHFVVTEYDIRSKAGKLADGTKPERGGSLGLNWMAQNTATIGYLAQWLQGKVAEYGGTVRRHRLSPEAIPKSLPTGHENKIFMARALRDDFLKTYLLGETA